MDGRKFSSASDASFGRRSPASPRIWTSIRFHQPSTGRRSCANRQTPWRVKRSRNGSGAPKFPVHWIFCYWLHPFMVWQQCALIVLVCYLLELSHFMLFPKLAKDTICIARSSAPFARKLQLLRGLLSTAVGNGSLLGWKIKH